MRRRNGFTLIELLVVVALIGGLAAMVLSRMRGGSTAVALQAGQATLANAVVSARTRAIASGRNVRLLVHDGALSPLARERFRRLIVVAEEIDGAWQAREGLALPEGVYVLPHRTRVRAGMFAVAAEWRTANNQETLGSSALSNAPMTFGYDTEGAQSWEWIAFTARGTIDGAGALIVAGGRGREPTAEATASPVEFVEAQNVRGLILSNYGVPRWSNDRTAF